MRQVGNLKSTILQKVALDAMRGEVYRALAATNGNTKAAAINLGYTNPQSFYTTLKRLGIKLERFTRVKPQK